MHRTRRAARRRAWTEALEPRALLSGSLSGVVYDDLDANSWRTPNEPALAGQTVRVTQVVNGGAPAESRDAVTGADGAYHFDDLPNGTWVVNYVPAGGRYLTGYSEPNRYATFPFDPALYREQYFDFGTALPASVSGTVFRDLDRDGVRDAGEGGVAGVTVFLDESYDGTPRYPLGGVDPAAVTDADGNWHIAGVGPNDDLWFRVQPPAGDVRTAPSAGFYPLTLRSGDALAGKDFGLAPELIVSGVKLVNAATDRPIGPLTHGMTIDLAEVGKRLNVRADLADSTPARDVRSVRFNFDGNPAYRVENATPYAIGGDTFGDYASWTPRVGAHSLVVTPYGSSGGAGEQGRSYLLNFTVIDTSAASAAPLRVNAGGGAYATASGDGFAADRGFRGALARDRDFAVAGTDDDALYSSYRMGRRMQFSAAVANGAYTLRLHFAEPVHNRAGRRVFDVYAEGRRVLSRYDVFADAGAKTAAVKQFPVGVSDGRLDLTFAAARDLAVVSAIELLPAVQSPGEAGPVLVDAGAPAPTTDSAGRVFEQDRSFTGGAASGVLYDVAGIGDFGNPDSPDDAVFATYHAGREFSFRRPVANGHYALLLDFAEPAEGAAVGSRTFDVFAEGRQILDDYDIVKAAGGARTAVADSTDVTITDGALDLTFRGVMGDALVSAIVLIPTDVAAAAKPYSVPLTDASRLSLSVNNARLLVYAAQFWGNSHKGKFPDSLADALADVGLQWSEAVASPRTSTRVPRGETLAFPELLAWASDRNDYVYVGAGSTYRDSPDKVVLYENPDRVEGPIVVGFLDGHVSVLPRAEAAALIGFGANAAPADPPPPWPDPNSPEYRRDPAVLASRDNLYRIVEGMWRHANNNRGFFPVDVVRLMLSQNVPAETFVNPRGDGGALPAGLDRFQQAEWVLRHGDYQLLPTAGRMRGTSIPPQVAIAWENPAELKGGIYLAFADGRVEFREMRWAVETIRRSFAWLELWEARR
jgi:hypothetical protein